MTVKGKAPLSFSDIALLIENPENRYIIDYNNSDLKGRKLLVYLANLDLNIDIEIKENDSSIFEMMEDYFLADIACKVELLDKIAAAILLESKDLDHRLLYPDIPVTQNDIISFIQKDFKCVYNATIFLDSMPLFMQKTIIKLDEMLNIKNLYETIDDKKYITSNIQSIIKLPGFLDYFLSGPPPIKMFYFEKQFNDYMFNGNNLYHHLIESESIVYATLIGLMSQDIDLQILDITRNIANEYKTR